MNRYPMWKNLMVLSVLVLGLLIALPNLYGEDPSIQVSPRAGSADQALVLEVVDQLAFGGFEPLSVALEEDRLLARFEDPEVQLAAADFLREQFGRERTVALNLAARTPQWMRDLGLQPMNLGLDLRGGVHFLLQVDLNAAVEQRLDTYEAEFRTTLREAELRYAAMSRESRLILINFRDPAVASSAIDELEDDNPDLIFSERPDGDGVTQVVVQMPEASVAEVQDFAVRQNLTTLRNRVNELGVAEPVVQRQGRDRIVVQLPGVQDTARAKDILGAVATLEFRMVFDGEDPYVAESSGRVPLGSRLYHWEDGRPELVNREVVVTGDMLTNATSGFSQTDASPAVFITLDSQGARRMSEVSRRNIGKPMAVIYIESRIEGDRTVRDERVINVATIRDVLSKRFQISGLEPQESRDLSLLLRAGALAAPVQIIGERTVGPSLGRDNVEQGFQATMIGLALVVVFMALYYRVFGMIANLALVANIVLLVALLSMLQATLTLPGIAGIVLTVGMAVDANVLIFERVREELRVGNSPQASIQAGYEKALSTIADANITTLIAAVVLFSFGTGPVKGFAITLSLGILTSMFTSIVGTRTVVNLVFGGRRLASLPI
jgi:preprotein translocase subunit SecD